MINEGGAARTKAQRLDRTKPEEAAFVRMLLGNNQNGFRHRLWCVLSDSW